MMGQTTVSSKTISRRQAAFSVQNVVRQSDHPIIALDGRCGSGKTTWAEQLAKDNNLFLVHADDYFLQLHQRTEERLNTPGENVDWERIEEQVLLLYSRQEPVILQKFDCATKTLQDKTTADLSGYQGLLIEGSYSLHERLLPYYSLSLFLDIDPAAQQKRLQKRESKESFLMFLSRWIPLEEFYISRKHPDLKADCIVES